MTEPRQGVNPCYASFQIARALTTSEEHEDAATRERAEARIAKWEDILRNILSGAVEYGSRTPVEGAPAWATLEVATGGFATGELLAGGPLREHETELLESLGEIPRREPRRALNAWFLTDEGLAQLRDRLRTGAYDVGVPEEGALLVVAWLAGNGHADEARALIEELAPFFPRLRFYPVPRDGSRLSGSRVHLQDVGKTLEDLRKIEPNPCILAQKEAIEVWAPLYDRMVALFLETVEDGWPCRVYPDRWPERALALLGEYAELRKEHRLCGKIERANGHRAQLREFLGRCARKPRELTGREVGRIRLILQRYMAKRGAPGSAECEEARRRQRADVSGPTHHEIAGVVIARLAKHSGEDGLDDVSHVEEPVGPEETPVPPSIRRKVERCLDETVEVLVERGLITSGETLARVLPQLISGIRSAGIADPELRQLYAAIYRAFRRRRSLLLLNLEKQVQIEELPWVAAIDGFRGESLPARELARQTLEEITVLTLTSFPHAILPNKLLQELRALVKGAGLDIPLVDELAADIFMGRLTGKFLESARRAAELLKGSLYAAYYEIDYEGILRIRPAEERPKPYFSRRARPTEDVFVQLCAARAGVTLGTWKPATNGMIIEQQQILTTQNLAALFAGLNLADALRGLLPDMARHCFEWICRRQQMKTDKWHADLIMLKNTAYAWRQMIFYLSLLPESAVAEFLRWTEAHLDEQPEEYRNRFRPALNGLVLAAEGRAPGEARRFLGWSKARHWLLPASAASSSR